MRISLYLQRIAFATALLIPSTAIITGFDADLLIYTGYCWIVGGAAAVWHRRIEERQ